MKRQKHRGQACDSAILKTSQLEFWYLAGCEAGASLKLLSEITGLSSSAVSRRHEAAKLKVRENAEMSKLVARTMKLYRQRCLRIAESQA